MKGIGAPDDADDSRARARLAEEVEYHPRLFAYARQSLFRRHLELNVRSATPLLAIVSREKRIDLSLLAALIQPPRSWPSTPLPTVDTMSMVGTRRCASSRAAIIRSHRRGGIVAHWDRDGEDVIAVRIVADALEVTVIDGELRLETLQGFGRLRIYETIPATVTIAMRSRAVGKVFRHDLLRDEEWPIVDVVECDDGSTIVTFRTGLHPWRMPEMQSPERNTRDGETK